MKVKLERINGDYHFEATGASGIPVFIDNKTGDEVKGLPDVQAGASPMELLLMGIGGCSAIDVVLILKKQKQEITGFRIEVEGRRKEVKSAKPFEAAHVIMYLDGKIDKSKALRAAALSFEKYCSVSITLEPSVKITHAVFLNGEMLKAGL